jgi:guanylate kinase
VGKTTVVEELLKRKSLALRRAITATTRSPRENEKPELSYHFWTPEEFDRAVAEDRMLESATVFGTDRYGTPRSEVDPYRAVGTGVVLVIDVQGAERVRSLCPDAYSIFIQPPHFAELESRLRGRGDVPEDRIRRRLETARQELARAREFDTVIINDDLGSAVVELERIIQTQFDKKG